MTLDELEALADAAMLAADEDEPMWYQLNSLMYAMGHEDDAQFAVAANPATIKALIALVRQQNEVIRCTSACATHAPQLTQQLRLSTLAAFEKFGRE